MTTKLIVAAFVLAATTMAALPVLAQPNDISLQGVLRSAGGDLVNGNYTMTFSLYESMGAQQPVFSKELLQVPVENGVYTVQVDFGGAEPAKDYGQLWLGVAVGDEAEYPRTALSSVPYALKSAYANEVTCTGCIGAEALGFTPVTVEALDGGDLGVGGTVTAAAFVGDGSGLTGISSPQGDCAAGWFIAGISADGSLNCAEGAIASVDGLAGGTITGDVEVAGALTVNGAEACTMDGNCGETLAQLMCEANDVAVYNGELWTCGSFGDLFDPSFLPADGLNEISNDLLTNQFVDTFTSLTIPTDIKDFYPPGVSDQIVVPDKGVAQALTVSLSITNSDLTTVDIYLYDPEGVEYHLYDKSGEGTALEATYPAPTLPATGDLTTWVGKNPQGTWILKVVDSGFADIEFDGQIVTWSIQMQTLSNEKVKVAGNLVVEGNITSAGGEGLTIDDEGNVALSGNLDADGNVTVGGNLTLSGSLVGFSPTLECVNVNANSANTVATATCPDGYTVTGGGFDTTPGPNGFTYRSEPSGNGWHAQENNNNIEAWARCCKIVW